MCLGTRFKLIAQAFFIHMDESFGNVIRASQSGTLRKHTPKTLDIVLLKCLNCSEIKYKPHVYNYLRQLHNTRRCAIAATHQIVWASCQTRKLTGCACTENAGKVFPATADYRIRYASRQVRHAGIAN